MGKDVAVTILVALDGLLDLCKREFGCDCRMSTVFVCAKDMEVFELLPNV